LSPCAFVDTVKARRLITCRAEGFVNLTNSARLLKSSFPALETKRHICQISSHTTKDVGILIMPHLKFWSKWKTSSGSKPELGDGPEAEVEQLGLFLLKDNIAAANNLE
jgi:hypothetical protein